MCVFLFGCASSSGSSVVLKTPRIIMLFENPAVAAKLPFPYNIPPPIQAAAGVPQIRYVVGPDGGL